MSFILRFLLILCVFFVQMSDYLWKVGVLFGFFTSNVLYSGVLSAFSRLEGVNCCLKANFLRRSMLIYV